MSKHVAVIGDGGWGTALALVLRKNGHTVTVWGPFPDYMEQVRASGENKKFLPGIALPEGIHWTTHREEAVDRADVAGAEPSRFRDRSVPPIGV